MSAVERLHYLKKILGKLPKTEFSEYDYPLDRIMDLMAAPDHVFKPEITVTDSEPVEVEVNSFVVSIRPKEGDVKVNFDRPITTDEYTVIPKDVIKVVGRRTGKLYLQALAGQTSKVRIEGLRLVD